MKLTKKEMIAYILQSGMMIDSKHQPLKSLDYMNRYLKKDVERLYREAVAHCNR